MNRIVIFMILFLLENQVFAQPNRQTYLSNWPVWRGPLMTGEAIHATPPIKWSETKNIKWKVQIPERGLSSPIVWENQIFITSAVSMDSSKIETLKKEYNLGNSKFLTEMASSPPKSKNMQLFIVFSFNRETGDILWNKVVNAQQPHERTHPDGSWASSSCATDGKNLIASFGSFGIFCFNMQGEQLWNRDLGDMKTYESFGEGISPVLYENKVIINWDHEGESFITALDVKTGNTIWKTGRNEHTTWATPLVINVDGNSQVVVSGDSACISYDVNNGNEIWRVRGLTLADIPSPVYSNNMVYFMSGYPDYACLAVNVTNAKGDLTGSSAVVWSKDEHTSYVPSPLLYKGNLYYLSSNKGILTCADAATGKIHYQTQKLKEIKGVYASPVAANGFVYVLGRNGVCYVIQAGDTFKQIAVNSLDDTFDASPALAMNNIILRSAHHLYCISKQ